MFSSLADTNKYVSTDKTNFEIAYWPLTKGKNFECLENPQRIEV